ncbi:MAG: hypothetical protein GC154_02450 [bacterium]|nr:hypothetical protein [bacterium]
MKLRFFVSLLAALCASLLLVLLCVICIALLQEHRIQELASHSGHVASLIGDDEAIRAFVEDQPDAPSQEAIENTFHQLVDGDPFLEELSLLDPFGKMRVRVSRPEEEGSSHAPVKRASPSLHEIISTGRPALSQESGEYFVPLVFHEKTRWGVLRVRWRPESTSGYFNLLKKGAFHGVAALFIGVFTLVYFSLKWSYERQQKRLFEEIRTAAGGGYAQRIDPKSFSGVMADVSIYINRILKEAEEEKNKNAVLDDALRHVERSYADSRKTVDLQTDRIESMRKEMREGLKAIFALDWCGVMIVDAEYKLHYANSAAERLLRLIQRNENLIDDERLRRCLAPMIVENAAEKVDDLCSWPQPGVTRTFSCRVRSVPIPTEGNENLYAVVLREESGFPNVSGSSYFSERVLREMLSSKNEIFPILHGDDRDALIDGDAERRFKTCLKRIVFYHELERNKLGPVVSVRFSRWLRDRFIAEDLFSDHLNVNIQPGDSDMNLCVPEKAAAELIDCLITMMGRLYPDDEVEMDDVVDLHPSVDGVGKAVLTISMSSISRKRALLIQDVIEDRCDLFDSNKGNHYTLDRLERDVCYSVFRCVRDQLKVRIESTFSENKRMLSVLITFSQHALTQKADAKLEQSKQRDSVEALMRNYFQPS